MLLLVKLQIEEQVKQLAYCILCVILVQKECGSPELCMVPFKILTIRNVILNVCS